MNEDRTRILSMIAEGKITVEEGGKLLDALGVTDEQTINDTAASVRNGRISFLRVEVKSDSDDNVNVRVPLNLIRAGIRLTSLIPPAAMLSIDKEMKKHGMQFDIASFKPEHIEELIQGLAQMQVDVNSKDGDKVRVWCE